MSEARSKLTGRCLCGAVRYEIAGPTRGVVICHCGQCRRAHGHLGAYAAVARDRLGLHESRGLAWYESSDTARRGFCRECGSVLFWEQRQANRINVAAGGIDTPTGLETVAHVYVADKGDYYEITDGLPQHAADMAEAELEPPRD